MKAVPSIISSDLTITGDLSSEGEIQVDGVVEGDIKCKALVIGVKGSVTGEIVADSVRLHGEVNGRMQAKSVFLAATARMMGDVSHESLAIEPGAFLEGHCRRITEGGEPAQNGKKGGSNKGAMKPAPVLVPAAAVVTPPRGAEDNDANKVKLPSEAGAY